MPFGGSRWNSGSAVTDFGFTGQRNEAYMELMDFNARHYAPALSRFISADSIVPEPGNSQAWNRYSYVYNNPRIWRFRWMHNLENKVVCPRWPFLSRSPKTVSCERPWLMLNRLARFGQYSLTRYNSAMTLLTKRQIEQALRHLRALTQAHMRR